MPTMTTYQRSQCASIIHSCAAAAAGGNLIPVPGVGAAADVACVATMAVRLANVFGESISSTVAKALAKSALARYAAKSVMKEFLKIIPFAGSLAASAISAATLESAGWDIANDFACKANVRKGI